MRCLWLVLVVVCACGGQKAATLFGPTPQPGPDDYAEVLETWTREDKVYQGLETKMFVTATFHTPQFRRAFAVAFPEIYGHGGNITRRELVDLTGDVEQFHNFFMSVYTAEPKWNDLSQSDSIWRLTLIGSEEVSVPPAQVIPIKIDANLTAVYPYITRFDKGYLVRFALADEMQRLVLDGKSNHVTLRIASALGVAELRWDIVPTVNERSEPPLARR